MFYNKIICGFNFIDSNVNSDKSCHMSESIDSCIFRDWMSIRSNKFSRP